MGSYITLTEKLYEPTKNRFWDKKSGQDCSEDICSEICGLCTHEPACQWISSWSNLEKEKMLKIKKEDTVLSKLVPKKLNISALSFPESPNLI